MTMTEMLRVYGPGMCLVARGRVQRVQSPESSGPGAEGPGQGDNRCDLSRKGMDGDVVWDGWDVDGTVWLGCAGVGFKDAATAAEAAAEAAAAAAEIPAVRDQRDGWMALSPPVPGGGVKQAKVRLRLGLPLLSVLALPFPFLPGDALPLPSVCDGRAFEVTERERELWLAGRRSGWTDGTDSWSSGYGRAPGGNRMSRASFGGEKGGGGKELEDWDMHGWLGEICGFGCEAPNGS